MADVQARAERLLWDERLHAVDRYEGIIASFLDDQAIDEFVISVVPVFIGDGIPLIARRHRHVALELLSSEGFEDGVVQNHYRVRNNRSRLVATPSTRRAADGGVR
jgi:hypothetical protein